jgi:hypothetical protein
MISSMTAVIEDFRQEDWEMLSPEYSGCENLPLLITELLLRRRLHGIRCNYSVVAAHPIGEDIVDTGIFDDFV